jgi:hypothetical protein
MMSCIVPLKSIVEVNERVTVYELRMIKRKPSDAPRMKAVKRMRAGGRLCAV